MYTYVVTACSILQLQFSYKDTMIFSLAGIFKSRIFKMVATAMTFEFGTIHYYHNYCSLKENSETCLCSSLDKYEN